MGAFYLLTLALPHLMSVAGYKTFRIPSASMRPGILQNEFILTKKINSIEDLEAGDVIVFSFSQYDALKFQKEEETDCVIELNQRYLVKRIVAQENDIVELEDANIRVNGISISKDSKSSKMETLNNGRSYLVSPIETYQKLMTRISKNHVFVLGDNRGQSADSRCWGEVPFEAIEGRAERVLFSQSETSGVRWSRVGEKVK